ncbi:MAG: histidinol-phosphatase [Rubellimicrobium sp.]|nr:histidinol-phosphatase [Rubellimicrobium sp.]
MPSLQTTPAPDLADIADFAARAACDAGKIALGWFRHPVSIDIKSDLSPVTEADRAVEADLRARIAASWPDHAILGEEYGARGAADAPTWVIDPIDGTRSFITGWPVWGVLLAFTEAHRPQVGVIHMPVLGETWTGIRGGGSWMTGRDGDRQPCRTSTCRELARARFYTTSPDYFDAGEQPAYRALDAAAGVPRFGGDCYGYALLASGHVDLVVETRLQPYDFLALVPVIEEAGGVITDWQGRPLTLDSGEQVVAAATPELHAEALALIAAQG